MLTKKIGRSAKGKSISLDKLQEIGKIALDYYKQIPITPNDEDFKLWINSLKEPMKSDFNKKGLEACKGVLNFQRFYLESRDFGMTEFMKNNLNKEDFEFWNNTPK